MFHLWFLEQMEMLYWWHGIEGINCNTLTNEIEMKCRCATFQQVENWNGLQDGELSII